MTADDGKERAARAAIDLVEPNMRLGIGTGSTAERFILALGERVRDGLAVTGVPTSERSRALCEREGIALTTLDATPELDLAVDGADEIDPGLRLIKGGGGALLREKIVAHAARRFVVIADGSKAVERLGAFPLPIEVVRFGASATRAAVEDVCERHGGGELVLRGGREPFVTDEGHLILDAHLGRIDDPEALAAALAAVPGVVEHGLFLGMADLALVADADAGGDGVREIRSRAADSRP